MGLILKAIGKKINDVALSELSGILINIAQEGGDVRDGIERYKDEIIGKITSKINL